MKNRTIYIVLFTAITLFSGCNFLEERSQSEVIPHSTSDFSELLLGSGYQPVTDPLTFLTLMDDDIEFFIEYYPGTTSDYAGSTSAAQYYPYYAWQPYCQDFDGNNNPINESPSSTAYYRFYEWIMGCNAVLEYIDEAIGTQQEKDRVKAEALANRAFHYFRLVNLYGEPYNHNPNALGVPLKLFSAIIDEFLERATVAEVYDQVVKDLSEAIRLMEPLPIIRGDFRINLPAMYIILSRVYLYMDNWAGCVAQATKAFDLGLEYFDMTAYTYVTTLPPTPYLYDNPEVQWVYGGSPYSQRLTFNPPLNVQAFFTANKVAKTGDSRGVETLQGGSLPSDRVYFYKYAGTGALSQTIRTAEACLNRAEANVQLNNLAAARADLNNLRRNRIYENSYAPISESITNAELLEAIRHERRLEFFCEHFRWFDLRRYGMPAITHRWKYERGGAVYVYTLSEKDPMYTLPFPQSLINRNPNLQQNPSGSMKSRESELESQY